jgi:hypothetical protein
MLVELVADIFQPHGVKLVKHGGRAIGIPPIACEPAEVFGLFRNDALLSHATTNAFFACKAKGTGALERKWTISS